MPTRRGELVPITGPDLNVVTAGQPDFTLTEHMARRLVGREEADRLSGLISDILADFDEYQCVPLRKLAAITKFRLYISTTPDRLLAKAINDVRPGDKPRVRELTFSPFQSMDEQGAAEGDVTVFRLFGRASSKLPYAIHDENQLEWLHSVRSDSGGLPESITEEIREKHLSEARAAH
ncbi:hypothetical protein [Pseudonocardia charpentierae]|uniref:DUF5753 domain-containing protein n=1 Tax=Pseudonocardia charpentierae TaxID=3075545 RepID=A0ABU2NHI5_9PSEU|nr:hypothetical protein [Pseudonocardia sp. DSM 45834]MDT0353426.1 hypothetical protein [Pseudonocardia sp. DSM 45834]